jgi:hypothetical protein
MLNKKERHLLELALLCAGDVYRLRPMIDSRVDEGKQLDPIAVRIWAEANHNIANIKTHEYPRMPTTEFVMICLREALGEAA